MKKQYIKPVSLLSATCTQAILAGSGPDGSSSWETAGDGNKNPDSGNIEGSGDASDFSGGTGAKKDVWSEWDD